MRQTQKAVKIGLYSTRSQLGSGAERTEPALEQRLLSGSQKDTKVRLETMGNMVCVKQAELAFRYLAHGGLR